MHAWLVALPVPNLILLFKSLLRDPAVARGPKIALAIDVVWLISQIDLLPEFLPVLGPIDAVVGGARAPVPVQRVGIDVVRTHWRGEPATLDAILRAVRIG
jgi:uncharacterized membrane protein YkvA (DUF1232 family)